MLNFRKKTPLSQQIHHSQFCFRFNNRSDAIDKMKEFEKIDCYETLLKHLIKKFPKHIIPYYDYPCLFHLEKIKNTDNRKYIFNDIGGSFGLHFNAVENWIPNLIKSWNIYEEKKIYQSIKRINTETNYKINFYENKYSYAYCDIFFSSGTLQYLNFDYPKDMILCIKEKPKYIFFNQLPLDPKISENIYTLQNIFESIVINTVFSKGMFVDSIKSCGYEIVDEWIDYSANCNIINDTYYLPYYTGLFFKLVQ